MTLDTGRYPLPSEELMHRVAGDGDGARFLEIGERSARQIDQVLAAVGRSLGEFGSILDWGCGCGRIIRWFDDLAAKTSLYGVDIDEQAITWCDQNLPFATFSVCQPQPPLEFPDGHFDLVFNHSVLTHLDERFQDFWLAELRRVTRPGGIVLLSVHGEYAFSVTEDAERNAGADPRPWRERLERDGILFVADDAHIGGPFPEFYHSSFHAPWYVFSHWAQYFNVRAYLPRADLDFQDIIVLERVTDADRTAPIPPTASGARDGGSSPAPSPSTSTHLSRAEELIARGPSADAPARLGAAGRFARRAIRRLTLYGEQHQRRVDEALVEALREKTNPRLDPLIRAVKEQGERLNRLERDVRAEIAAIWKSVEGRASEHPEDSR
ncbi:MAG: class I SAM-dependent methyltransferase [Actinomycetota bacterium]|jgi:SAM-dependent methyltransferase|nr:class I SAM-dependent methyltransferase [Actinomycetota bacterium]